MKLKWTANHEGDESKATEWTCGKFLIRTNGDTYSVLWKGEVQRNLSLDRAKEIYQWAFDDEVEQRRFELVKAALQGILARSYDHEGFNKNENVYDTSASSLEYADTILKAYYKGIIE